MEPQSSDAQCCQSHDHHQCDVIYIVDLLELWFEVLWWCLSLRQDLKETFIDSGVMSAIKEWISPLPDKSLPALRIREELLRILQEVSTGAAVSGSPVTCRPEVQSLLVLKTRVQCFTVCFLPAAAQCESGDSEAQRDRAVRHVSLQTSQRVSIQQRPRSQTHQ